MDVLTNESRGQLVSSYRIIAERIFQTAQQCGRDPRLITLLAVSKGQSAAKIRALHEATGHTDFAENYTQELLSKAILLQDLPIRWHFIGQLQSNKIAATVKAALTIHAVSSERHAGLIAEHAQKCGKTPYPIYIAVNAANEAGKSGVTLSEAPSLAQKISKSYRGQLQVCGMMAVPPPDLGDENNAEVPELYLQLAKTAKQMGDGALSLGMSSDLGIAIRAGSTCVRIGTAIFGERLK